MILPHGRGDLYHKYRPLRFKEIVGHKAIIKSLRSAVNSAQPSQAYLFTGDSGTGKTTSARILALSLNCIEPDKTGEPCLKCKACAINLSGASTDIIEVNCANHRGIDAIRALCGTMHSMPMQLRRKVYILDECFPGETPVMVDYDKAISIKDVVEKDSITHVLAYDLERRTIAPRKILSKYKRPYSDKIVKVSFSDGTYVRSTRQHKYYTQGNGYVPAEELLPGDKLIEYAGDFYLGTACPHCNWSEPIASGTLSAHIMREHRHLTSHVDYTDGRVGVKIPESTCKKLSVARKAFYASDEGKKLKKKRSKEQMGANNTIFRYMTPSEVSVKASAISRKFWAGLSAEERARRIKIFINAPKYNNLPNRCETKIISWGITGLKYVGDGSLFVTLTLPDGSQIHKNPDFVYKQDNKVKKIIEVMDFEYWHTREEAGQIVNSYKNIGYDCLVIDAKRINKDKTVRGEIEAFVNNHYREITSVEVEKYNYRGNFVYDIEVEEDHNFFVVPAKYKKHYRQGRAAVYCHSSPVLVSNCHQLTKDAQSSLLKELEEAPDHVFIILSTTDPQKVLRTVKTRCQQFTFKGLNKKDLVELLSSVAVFEGYDFEPLIYEEIANASGGSPRQALVFLQQVAQLGPTTRPEITRLLETGDTTDKGVFALCVELASTQRKWSNLMSLYEDCKELGPPAIGMVIAGFYRNKLIKAKGKAEATNKAAILSLFVNPLPEGKPGENLLILNLYKAHTS